MPKVKNKKAPYCFSIRADLVKDIVYFKKTTKNSKLDQHVENLLLKIIPARNDTING